MRISKEEKQKTHRTLVEAAVEVISTRGFRDATMREIAERAGVADATIYKYFPTKESLLFAFFVLRMDDLVERLKAIPDFHEYSFREQFHVLLETKLEIFAPDRPFVRIAYKGVFLMDWVASAAAAKAIKDRFVAIIDDLVASAVEAGEFNDPPFKSFLYELLWEYTVGVTWYWLEDDSRKYANTTQMIDKSLAVIDTVLKSNILNRAVELVQFFVREHLLSKINRGDSEGPAAPLSDLPRPRPKRQFMTGDTPDQLLPQASNGGRRRRGRATGTQRQTA